MSAYIVGNIHISAMLQAATTRNAGYCGGYYWNGEARDFSGHIQEIGQKLVDENYRSVNCRYDENAPPDIFCNAPLRAYTVVEVIKACQCYEYQSCETEDWEETEAYAIVQALGARAIRMLPGYDAAQWNIVEEGEK